MRRGDTGDGLAGIVVRLDRDAAGVSVDLVSLTSRLQVKGLRTLLTEADVVENLVAEDRQLEYVVNVEDRPQQLRPPQSPRIQPVPSAEQYWRAQSRPDQFVGGRVTSTVELADRARPSGRGSLETTLSSKELPSIGRGSENGDPSMAGHIV
ncbi:hypothetical protein CGMCC3_g17877 [Colletotrichum fructicola]|nr:uncharacterized protein CGMCC3_g17877 [Colletotrichum fructicola]KAE9565941.1 hypothetical protein CGMCC3_g17877 [Colletotrichum fructicola]